MIFGTKETLLDSARVREWNGESDAFRHAFRSFQETLSAAWGEGKYTRENDAYGKETGPWIIEEKYSAFEKLMLRLADFMRDESAHTLLEMQKQEIVTDLGKEPAEMCMMQCHPTNKSIPVVFVPDVDESGSDNILELIKELRGREDDPNSIFMDMQGGARTTIYVNNAVLQILNESEVYHTKLTQVVATNFTPGRSKHPIIDETHRYKIVELVSGMTAFLKHGHADVISHYLESISRNHDQENPGTTSQVDENVKALVDAMREIDRAITYSRLESPQEDSPADEVDLVTAVEHLKTAVQTLKCETEGYSSSVKKIFRILTDAITDDYGDLLDGESVSVISLMEWLIKKNNPYVASSVAESKLPSFFVRSGLLYYAKTAQDLDRAEQTFRFYLACSGRQRYLFRDIHHFFIKSYISGCTYGFQWSNKQIEKMKQAKKPKPILPPYEKACNILACLKHPKNYPIPIYSDYPEDTVGRILVLYFYIAQNRNNFAHSDSAQDAMQAMEELIKLLKKCTEKNGLCADKASVWNWYQEVQDDKHQIPQAAKDELWRYCLKNEIFSGAETPLGISQYPFMNRDNPPWCLPEYYALGGLLYPMKMLKEKWTADDPARAALLKDKAFKPFLLLWLKYCNESGDRNPKLPEYDDLIRRLFPRGGSAASAFENSPDNRAILDTLWGSMKSITCCYYNNKKKVSKTVPDWKQLFAYYLDSDDERLEYLVQSINTANTNMESMRGERK